MPDLTCRCGARKAEVCLGDDPIVVAMPIGSARFDGREEVLGHRQTPLAQRLTKDGEEAKLEGRIGHGGQ
jgi:hypothetical protein